MIFIIRTVSGALVAHPWAVAKNDGDNLYQIIDLKTIDDLLKLQKDLGLDLLICGSDWDKPEIPMIRVYDDYLE